MPEPKGDLESDGADYGEERRRTVRAAGSPGRGPRALVGWPLKAAVSGGLIALLAGTVEWQRAADSLRATNIPLMVAAFCAIASTPILSAEKWRSAALACGVSIPRRFFVGATYAAIFAGQFLPAGIGVDAARFGLLWHRKVPLRNTFQCLFLDRLAGIAAIFVLMFVGIPFALDLLPPGGTLPVVAAAACLAAAFAAVLHADKLPLPRRLKSGRVGHLLDLFAGVRAATGTLRAGVALGCGLGLHLLSIFAVYLLARALGYELRFQELLTVTSAAFFAALMPVSFNGWGVREGAMVLGLSLLGVPREIALTISLLFGVGSALASLPGSVSWHRLKRLPGAGRTDDASTA